MRMRRHLTRCMWIVVMTLGLGFTGGTAQVMASSAPQDQHHQDYSKNKNYQQGMRDGRDDNAHNRDHSKKRKFKKDQDRNDYETGYQVGHQNPPDHK
jgi:hypothetical protein